jgi:uncharacterized membrane protein
MATLKASITINAPVDKVFAYLSDPNNLPKVWPSLVEVKDVRPAPAGGYNFSWVYKMAGMRFDGASETVEQIPNQRTVTRSTKGIETHFVWTYEPENGGTKLTVEIEYKVPVPLLGNLAEALIVKQNEQEAATLLANLKAKMEA